MRGTPRTSTADWGSSSANAPYSRATAATARLTRTELRAASFVGGAYFGGVRGGLLTALWAILVTTVAFFVLHDVQTGYYAVSVVAYAAVGIGLGSAVERVVTQRRRLQDVVDDMQAMQRQLRASQKRYRLLFEASNDAVYLHGLDAHGEPTRFAAVNDSACRLLG